MGAWGGVGGKCAAAGKCDGLASFTESAPGFSMMRNRVQLRSIISCVDLTYFIHHCRLDCHHIIL